MKGRQVLPRKRFSAEQIIAKLREAEVMLAQGKNILQVYKKMGVIDQTHYVWRKEYGGIRTDQRRTVINCRASGRR